MLNPVLDEMPETQLELVVAGTSDAVLMVESEAKELSEDIMLGAVMFGHRHFQPVIDAIIELAEKAAKEPRELKVVDDSEIEKEMLGLVEQELRAAYAIPVKQDRYAAVGKVKEKAIAHFFPEGQEPKYDKLRIAGVFKELEAKIVRWNILDTGKRIDGRDSQDRPQHPGPGRRAAARPRLGAVHPRRDPGAGRDHARHRRGRAVCRFARRVRTKRRSCCTTTSLPTRSARPVASVVPSAARSATASWRGARSVRCCRRITSSPTPSASSPRSPSSNGSSSMASVCGASLALMDAGVPLKRPTAGIAMGLILEGERFAVLSDILGDEDHLGDMDFKVAGTEQGITSLQMDIKIAGITEEIMKVALGQAKDGRIHILGEMSKALDRARAELGEHAPRIETFKIPTDKIREVIGTGGKVIREIVEKTGAKVNIEDDGTVKVASADGESIKAAIKWIKSIASDPEARRRSTTAPSSR